MRGTSKKTTQKLWILAGKQESTGVDLVVGTDQIDATGTAYHDLNDRKVPSKSSIEGSTYPVGERQLTKTTRGKPEAAGMFIMDNTYPPHDGHGTLNNRLFTARNRFAMLSIMPSARWDATSR